MSGDEPHATSPALQVVEAIAAARGVRTVELDPLSERLDLEAMDELLANTTEPIRIECLVDEFRVTVGFDGDVEVSTVRRD